MPTRPFRTDLYLSLPLFLSSLLASNHHPLPPFLSLRLLSPSLKMSTTRRTTRLNGSAAAPFVPSTQTNGHANGSSSPSGSSTNEVRTKGKATVDGKKKTFWEEYEVPRKALHASIGEFRCIPRTQIGEKEDEEGGGRSEEEEELLVLCVRVWDEIQPRRTFTLLGSARHLPSSPCVSLETCCELESGVSGRRRELFGPRASSLFFALSFLQLLSTRFGRHLLRL